MPSQRDCLPIQREFPMLLLKRYSRLAVSSVLLVTLVACSSTPRLAETPNAGANLSGVWSSDVTRSDDVRTKLRLALEDTKARQRGMRELPVPDDHEEGREGGRRGPRGPIPTWLLEDERAKREDLMSALVPASKLQIQQTDNGIVFSPLTGGGVRDLTPSERSTLFTSFATLRIVCGWEANTFYVQSADPESGLKTTERYTLIDGGQSLEELLQINISHLKEQKYRIVYTRVPADAK